MARDGVDVALRGLVAETVRPSVLVGVVDLVEEHAEFGYLVRCTIRPDGSTVQARLCWLSAGPGRGDFTPVEAGAEVLILCPGGERNRAIALAGLSGGARATPDGWGNDARWIVEPGGVQVKTADEAVVQRVVVESLLGGLADALQELAAGLTGLGVPTPLTTAFVAELPTGHRSAALEVE